MGNKEKRCRSCEYFESKNSKESLGKCHFNAPMPSHKHPMMKEDFYKEASIDWPYVQQTDWCGQYKDKK